VWERSDTTSGGPTAVLVQRPLASFPHHSQKGTVMMRPSRARLALTVLSLAGVFR
jgi:hypothetical protein